MKTKWKTVSAVLAVLTIVSAYHAGQKTVVEKEVVRYEKLSTKTVQSFTAEVTAYTAGYESCGKLPNHPAYGITANGNKVRKGIIAADTNVLPFGTKVYIEDLGIFTVDDTGGDIKGNRIDIYMDNLNEAVKFGRQNRKLIVLN